MLLMYAALILLFINVKYFCNFEILFLPHR